MCLVNVASLYETFFKVFWDKVLKQKDFFSEVLYFKRIQKKVALHCSDDRRSTTLTIMQSKWSKGFTLTSEDCYFIRMNEATFTKHIHKKKRFVQHIVGCIPQSVFIYVVCRQVEFPPKWPYIMGYIDHIFKRPTGMVFRKSHCIVLMTEGQQL
jgi:hypothetical protein